MSRTPDARRSRSHEPSILYTAGEPSEVTLNLKEIPETEAAWREEITRVTGLPLADHRKVELAQVRYWGPKADPYVYCRFVITDRPDHLGDGPNATALLRELRGGSRRSRKPLCNGDSALVLSMNDWQVGKLEGGGTAALAARLDRALEQACTRVNELRRINRSLGELVIIGGGDLVEGCDMFQNHAFEVDSDRRTQIRNTVSFILDGLDRLAPLFSRVSVLAVGGNHGENRIGHKRTTRGDNDDCAVFEHAALAASRDQRLQHVQFRIAEDEPAKTMEVAGWILGTTHGQAYGKTMSGSVEQKAFKWFSGQAAGRHPVGDSDILLTHHFHHYAARDWGSCQWIQTPAMDGGSAWVADMNGQTSQPGMLSFVMTPQERIKDIQILG